MDSAFNHPWELGVVMAIVLATAMDLGRRTAAHSHIQDDANRKDQMTAIRDGLFVLVSLLLGFTFALAAPRYAERRSLLIEEAISIGTTYLRASTLPQPYRDHSQQLLRDYVDTRLDLDQSGLDSALFDDASRRSKRIQEQLWADAQALAQTDRSALMAVYLNSLNETIDLHEKRVAAFENRIPHAIWALIVCISIIAVFTRGLTLARGFWLTLVLAPITIAIVVALIADLDTPSSGLIRLDQRAMLRLKADLTPPPAH
jgi:hypothetical protein